MNTRLFSVLLSTATLPVAAHAQLQIDWYTIDGGGGSSSGGALSITGTIGQPDAGNSAGGTFQIAGGFLGGATQVCYSNCDNSTSVPILNVNDFICFSNLFAAGDSRANCDASTIAPVLNVNDFICFQQKFAAGCP